MGILAVQQRLKVAGFDPGPLDGKWGARTAGALDAALGLQPESLAWGAKVSAEFRARAVGIAQRLGVHPDHLMACMAFESGESFRADVRNAAGSGATGLIQFMPATARELGTTTEALARMTPENQLGYVERYFAPYAGRLQSISDVYMAILWPKAIGKPEGYVLWEASRAPTTYRQNAGLDANRDHAITKSEAATKVRQKLQKGLQPGYLWKAR